MPVARAVPRPEQSEPTEVSPLRPRTTEPGPGHECGTYAIPGGVVLVIVLHIPARGVAQFSEARSFQTIRCTNN